MARAFFRRQRGTVQAGLIVGILTMVVPTIAQTVEADHPLDGGMAASTELIRGLGIDPFKSCTVASGGEFNRGTNCIVDDAAGSAVSGLTQALSSIEQEQQAVVAPNACSINNGGCSSDATCTVKGKTSYCECKPGYTGTGIVCSDVNECTAKNSPCPNNSTCTNTVGSFSCACNAGYMMVNKQCKVSTAPSCSTNNGGCSLNATCSAPSGTVVCTCNSGYTGNGTTCTDVNECATNNGGCYANAFCTNTPGSRTCTCNSGYSGDGITTCTDINECLTNNGGCSTNGGVCTNTAGGRTCSCGSGYTGNGLTCADINECASGNGGCSANATCTNTPGARTCGCNTGYAGDGVTCTDINECATTNGGCDLQHGVCTNTVGTRTCACEPGYSGNGFTCTQDAQDTVVPSLTSVTVPEGNIAAGVPFAVSATATDNISGVKSITFGLTWWTDFTPGGYYPDGHFAAYCTVSATPPYALSLTNGCNMTLPAQALAGTYGMGQRHRWRQQRPLLRRLRRQPAGNRQSRDNSGHVQR